MFYFLIGAIITFGTWGIDLWQIHYKEKKIRRFHYGEQIYYKQKYWNGRMEYSERTSTGIANGEGYCRPQTYSKLRLPFQSQYKERRQDNDFDNCTGEIFNTGKWSK